MRYISVFDLNETELAEIVNIAENGKGNAKTNAREHLNLLTDHCCDCICADTMGYKNSGNINYDTINHVFGSKVKIMPNPAKDYEVFELSTTNYNSVISTLGEGHSAGRRNLPAMKDHQRINGSHSSKEIPHPTAKSQPKGFGMTANNGMTVVVFNVFGQKVHSETLYQYQLENLVNINNWQKGIYFAVVYSNGLPVGKCKFVVQ